MLKVDKTVQKSLQAHPNILTSHPLPKTRALCKFLFYSRIRCCNYI